jgi:hypothetical protein
VNLHWTFSILTFVMSALALLVALAAAARVRKDATAGDRSAADLEPYSLLDEVKTRIEPFEATTTGGEPIDLSALSAPETLVGFFMSDCSPCKEQLPPFVTAGQRLMKAGSAPLAVVVGDPSRAASVVAHLPPSFRVVIEADQDRPGSITHIFGIKGYPTFLLLTAGEVVSAAPKVDAAVAKTPLPARQRRSRPDGNVGEAMDATS